MVEHVIIIYAYEICELENASRHVDMLHELVWDEELTMHEHIHQIRRNKSSFLKKKLLLLLLLNPLLHLLLQ